MNSILRRQHKNLHKISFKNHNHKTSLCHIKSIIYIFLHQFYHYIIKISKSHICLSLKHDTFPLFMNCKIQISITDIFVARKSKT